jgi:uncharacterized phiE125 gp8 family phage protein
MAIFINSTYIVQDAIVEPVSLADAKAWMRIVYDTDDSMIEDLITSARLHLEKISGLSLANKLIRANIELSGIAPQAWMVDLPYGPVICVDEVKFKSGLNTYDIYVVNEDYEIVNKKLWLYNQGNFIITYQAGYASLPGDLKNDLLTLVAWMYENRGKKMNADPKGVISQFPNWDGLNYHQYKTVVI